MLNIKIVKTFLLSDAELRIFVYHPFVANATFLILIIATVATFVNTFSHICYNFFIKTSKRGYLCSQKN